MPPLAAIAPASEVSSAEDSSVSVRRTIRQSGSLSQSRRCIQARVSTLRIALAADGSVGSSPGMRARWLRCCQLGATSGPMRMPSTMPTAAPSGRAAAEQEASRRRRRRGSPRGPRRRRPARVDARVVSGRLHRRHVEEVELQVREAHAHQRGREAQQVARDVLAGRVERVDPALARPVRMHEAAERAAVAVRSSQSGCASNEPALGHHAERREPDARRGSPRSRMSWPPAARGRAESARSSRASRRSRAGSRRRAARGRSGSRRVPWRAPRDCGAGRPRSPGRRTGTSCTSPPGTGCVVRAPAARAELFRERFEQAVRIVGERDEHPLQLEPSPGLERRLEARLDLDQHVVSVAAQVDDAGREPALEQAGEAAHRARPLATDTRSDSCQPAPVGRRRAERHGAFRAATGPTGRRARPPSSSARPALKDQDCQPWRRKRRSAAGRRPSGSPARRNRVDRRGGAVGDDAIEARALVGRVERERDREGAEALDARRERALDPVQRADRARRRYARGDGVGRVAEAEANAAPRGPRARVWRERERETWRRMIATRARIPGRR